MRPYRKEKVASAVRDIVSEAIANRLNDPRVAPLTTVSRVQMAGDLTVATVYLTVPGDEATERLTMSAMRHATGFLQRVVAHQLGIRQCPELRFEVDETVRQVRETMRLLDDNRRERAEQPEFGELEDTIGDDDAATGETMNNDATGGGGEGGQ